MSLTHLVVPGRESSRGFGSVSSEQMESRTLLMVRAGLHCSLRMSRQIWPLLLMLQWYILVRNVTCMTHNNRIQCPGCTLQLMTAEQRQTALR